MTANILCVTLARGGSKGVPNKHTRQLAGKPVLQYTLDAVLNSKYSKYFVVSSDDNKILKMANHAGADTILRPAELCLDTTPTQPALQHAVQYYEKYKQMTFDYIAEIRATSPLKTTEDIEGAIDLMIGTNAESVIGVTALDDHHPARIKWLDERGYIRDFMPEPDSGRRQDCTPPAYIRNGTIYVLRRDRLGKLFGHDQSIGYIMPAERSVNIDTELDFKLCEVLLA